MPRVARWVAELASRPVNLQSELASDSAAAKPPGPPAAHGGTRIDAAHALRTEAAPGRTAAAEEVSCLDAEQQIGVPVAEPRLDPWGLAAEQLRRQAHQLREYLDQRHREHDRREARLNADSAELENQGRAIRLWLREQQALLDEREAELRAREAAIAERASQIAAAEVFQDRARREASRQIDQRQYDLDRREAQLLAQKQRLDIESAALAKARGDTDRKIVQMDVGECPVQQQIEVQRASSQDNDLVIAESRLARERRNLTARRQRLAAQVREARQRVLERAQRWLALLRQRAELLREEKEALRTRRVQLEQVRLELGQKRRELLEARTSAEQLLTELCRSADSTELHAALAKHRARLSTASRLSMGEANTKRPAADQVRAEIAASYQRLVKYRDQMRKQTRRLLAKRETSPESECPPPSAA